MAQILLVEDDPSVARALVLGLQRLGHTVRHEPNGDFDIPQALAQCEVILLDLGLPGRDGFDICREVRANSSTPIVMLTARSDDIDVVAGLESGADDYVVKPTSPRVLDARVKAVLRRTAPTNDAEPEPVQVMGALRFDKEALEVRRDGELLSLTPTEIRLLAVLSENPGRVLSRDQLLRAAWDQSFLGDSRIVDSAIQRLRAKIEPDPSMPQFIDTVRGFGYRFTPGT